MSGKRNHPGLSGEREFSWHGCASATLAGGSRARPGFTRSHAPTPAMCAGDCWMAYANSLAPISDLAAAAGDDSSRKSLHSSTGGGHSPQRYILVDAKVLLYLSRPEQTKRSWPATDTWSITDKVGRFIMKTFTRNVVMAVSTLCVAGTFLATPLPTSRALQARRAFTGSASRQ